MIERSVLRHLSIVLVVFPIVFAPAAADAPDEVAELFWCDASIDCLTWSPLADAEGYEVYRGAIGDARDLLGDGAQVCIAGSYPTPTTGATVGDPPPSVGHWYLVTARNVSGEGSAGSGTDGPRQLPTAGACDDPVGGLVLNEVDYDQTGADTAEFVEIFNGGIAPLDLTDVALVFVNGSNESEYARVSLEAAGSLAPGGYVVVGASPILVGLPSGVVGLPLPGSIQNGAPDAIALLDVSTGAVIDALSYEGEIRGATLGGLAAPVDLVEGTPTPAADSGDGVLARVPDGRDSDDAASDWALVAVPTPGTANPSP